jgi:hypothetical protein
LSEARLASGVLASALARLCAREGGFAAVLRHGDDQAGAILLEMREKGRFAGYFERFRDLKGSLSWQRSGPDDLENILQNQDYVLRRQSMDPDIWVIELDVPDVQRFIAGLSSLD